MKYTVTLTCVILFFTACGVRSVSSYNAENKKIDATLENHAVDSMIFPYRVKLTEEMKAVIGYSDTAMIASKSENILGNFVSDVIFETGFDYSKNNSICHNTNAIFCLLNSGGFRRSINKGAITKGDIYELMPFDNTIVIVEISTQKMEELADYLVVSNGQPVSNAKFFLAKQNNRFIVGDQSTASKSYYVITSDYLASGGDKMDFLKEPLHYWSTGILIRDALIFYIQKKQNIGSWSAEKRIFFE